MRYRREFIKIFKTKKFLGIFLFLIFIIGISFNLFSQIHPPKQYFDNPTFPYAQKVADGVSILKNYDPVKQTLAAGKKSDLTLKEGMGSFKWVVKLTSGTVFEFGKVAQNGILPVVHVQNSQGYFVEYTPSNFKETVQPKASKNTVEWQVGNGISMRYTMMQDRVKEDIIVKSKSSLTDNKVQFDVTSG